MRIDLLLYRLRFARSRSVAKALVEAGHIRRNGARIERACAATEAGDVLTIPIGKSVCIAQIDALPQRRGPAAEARQCYRRLDQVVDPAGQTAIAGTHMSLSKGTEPQ